MAEQRPRKRLKQDQCEHEQVLECTEGRTTYRVGMQQRLGSQIAVQVSALAALSSGGCPV